MPRTPASLTVVRRYSADRSTTAGSPPSPKGPPGVDDPAHLADEIRRAAVYLDGAILRAYTVTPAIAAEIRRVPASTHQVAEATGIPAPIVAAIRHGHAGGPVPVSAETIEVAAGPPIRVRTVAALAALARLGV